MIYAIFAILGALGAGVVYFGVLAPPKAEVDLEALGLEEIATPTPVEKSRPSLREVASGPLALLTRPFLRGKRDSQLQVELSRAGLSLKAHEFFLAQIGMSVLLALIALARFGNILVVLGAVIAGYFLPVFYLRRRQRARRKALESALSDTVVLLSNGLKAGYSAQQAMNNAAENGQPPLSEEIGRVVRETSLGIDLETALEHANRRMSSKDFDLMVTALKIHRTVGGNLAEVLDKIAETIRERVRVQGEVRVLTAQARASGYIITALPFALAVLLSFVSPSFERPLFTNPLGWVFIAISLISISIGYAIIRKITDIKL